MKKLLTILIITIFIGCAGETASVQEDDIDSNTELALDVAPEATVDIGGTDEASTVKQSKDEDNIESINNNDEDNIESIQDGNLILQCTQGTNDPLNTWIKAKGPIGGLGYNVRYRHDNPNIMYFTDVWSGVQKSVDGGLNWVLSNGEGEEYIDFKFAKQAAISQLVIMIYLVRTVFLVLPGEAVRTDSTSSWGC